MLPAHIFTTHTPPHPLPPEAVELFGHGLGTLWETAGDPAIAQAGVPWLIGATTDGQWLAGLMMTLETLERAGLERANGAGSHEHVASIRQVTVSAGYRGAGLATQLLRRAVRLAAEAGCDRVRSTAGHGCPDHIFLHERMRFTRAAPGDRPYLMTRDLRADPPG